MGGGERESRRTWRKKDHELKNSEEEKTGIHAFLYKNCYPFI